MSNLRKEYTKEDLTVIWEPGKCIHSTICANGLSEVFRPKDKPWIQLDKAESDRIKKQIDQCPSGALSYVTSAPTETATSNETEVEVIQNGPLIVKATVKITDKDGNTEIRLNRSSFCRCGASENKPYCDGSHRKIEFVG